MPVPLPEVQVIETRKGYVYAAWLKIKSGQLLFLVLRLTKTLTNEIDGFVRQASV
jgi:hypothetical protein